MLVEKNMNGKKSEQKNKAGFFDDPQFQIENDKLEAQLELWREHRHKMPFKE